MEVGSCGRIDAEHARSANDGLAHESDDRVGASAMHLKHDPAVEIPSFVYDNVLTAVAIDELIARATMGGSRREGRSVKYRIR